MRRARAFAYRLRGRNKLVYGSHLRSFSQEFRSVHGFLASRSLHPAIVGQGELGNQWRTAFGDFWISAGLDPLYVRLTIEEQLSDIYHISPLPSLGVVLDCGANIGLFTKSVLQMGAKKVYAFEPSPVNVACFRANISDGMASGAVHLVEKGLYNTSGELRFSEFVNDPFANAISETGTIRIPVVTIDEIVEELNLQAVDFIKMDIEGSEFAALEGAQRTLKRFRPRVSVAVEHTDDFFANANAVIQQMASYGYDYVITQYLPYESRMEGATAYSGASRSRFRGKPISVPG